MTKLNHLVTVPSDEKPFINFEESLDVDGVVSGYVPVKSTLDVFGFLKESTGLASPKGRAVICVGAYGSGKSRLCTVLARLFRDGFECTPLQRVWQRLDARGQLKAVTDLRQILTPGGRAWHRWLVVPMYAQAGGSTIAASLVRSLVKALRREKIDDSVLGQTIYHAAARRLKTLVDGGSPFRPSQGSPFSNVEQLQRALEQDFNEEALLIFREFHKQATHGIDFLDVVQSSPDVAMQPHEVFNAVAEQIQPLGYAGIVVLWDEFGFAIEELLRGGQSGRSLGVEAQTLQDFVERSCSTNDLGKRVVFLGFTHRSIEEYGTRAGLNENDRNRLATTSGRFRNPPLFIRLSVTETEGYHLLSGMIPRTDEGQKVFANPVVGLQHIAERMTKFKLWERLSADVCYEDIAAPCYPLHPTTAASLLLLSDQIEQANRTIFYYLQDRNEGGLAGVLDNRDLPPLNQLGGAELLRVHDLFRFFLQPFKENRRQLLDQYEEAVARFPTASEMDLAVLQTIMVLLAIKNPDVTPTTDILSFSLCDVQKEERGAEPLHDSLRRLNEAGVIWKNEATDVWSFVGERGLGSELDRELDDERALIHKIPPCELLRRYPQLQGELVDRLGDTDLDPSDSGVVRTIGVRILDISQGEAAIETANPASNGSNEKWRSAMVYLVAVDTATQLDAWRRIANQISTSNVYFIFPPSPLALTAEKLRDLIAVSSLLKKKDAHTHAYEVLEAKLTRLRRELREQFEKAFGNVGLRSGTIVERAGDQQTSVPVSSWNELLPAIGTNLESEFPHQLRVRCGTFNEWQTGSRWAPITKIVERILGFDDHTPWQSAFLDFNETGQEAAIVDGVLIENKLFSYDTLTDKWELHRPNQDSPLEVLREALRHFQTGGAGDREFLRLYNKLIDPPFGIPNGVIPIVLALVFRAEAARIGVYEKSGSQLQRVKDDDLPDALVGMARSPERYKTRYNKLSSKQRFIFRALGPEMGLPLPERASGERLQAYCEEVRTAMKNWMSPLPDGILSIADLTDGQKKLIKQLRGPVPPQLSLLADLLIDVLQEDPNTREEIADHGTRLTSFPATTSLWREFRNKISRYVEGVKAPVRSILRDVVKLKPEERGLNLDKVVEAIKPLQRFATENDSIRKVIERLENAPEGGDLAEEVAAAIANKPTANLTDEDFGRAAGMLEVIAAISPPKDGTVVLLPNGERRVLPSVQESAIFARVESDVKAWRQGVSLSQDESAALALAAIYARVEEVDTSGSIRDGQSSSEIQPSNSSPVATSQTDAH
jgi:hypothetical protein